MRFRVLVKATVGAALLAGLAAAGFFTWEAWLPYLLPHTPASNAEDNHDHPAGSEVQQVKLSPQAQGNIRLVTRPLTPETFWHYPDARHGRGPPGSE